MANVHGSKFMRWDTLTGAASPFRFTKVIKILVECPSGAGGTTTLQRGGNTFWSAAVATGDVTELNYPEPQDMHTLTCTALGTGVIVNVEYA